MFIRTFVIADNEKEAICNSEQFNNLMSKCILDLEIEKVEQYWKFPELYCVEYKFSKVLREELLTIIEELGDEPHRIINSDGTVEYIFSTNTGEMFIDKIDWILINIEWE